MYPAFDSFKIYTNARFEEEKKIKEKAASVI